MQDSVGYPSLWFKPRLGIFDGGTKISHHSWHLNALHHIQFMLQVYATFYCCCCFWHRCCVVVVVVVGSIFFHSSMYVCMWMYIFSFRLSFESAWDRRTRAHLKTGKMRKTRKSPVTNYNGFTCNGIKGGGGKWKKEDESNIHLTGLKGAFVKKSSVHVLLSLCIPSSIQCSLRTFHFWIFLTTACCIRNSTL